MYWDIVKWRPYHMWLDYAGSVAWQSVPVYSCHKWTVMVLNDANWFGKYIVIEDDWYSTYYAHLASVSVKSWDYVKANTQVGMMWSSGNSTAVHLHLGLKVNWQWVDPTTYIVDRIEEPKERQVLVEQWIFSWEFSIDFTERTAIICSRIFKKLSWK